MQLLPQEVFTMSAMFKQQAHQMIDALPEDAGWNELIYRAQVRKEIDTGLADSFAGRVTDVDEVIRELAC